MSALLLAQSVNRFWVMLYTAGLTPAQQAERKAEIECDMFEQHACFALEGCPDRTIASQVVSRMWRGWHADVLWRMSAGREAERLVTQGTSPPLPFLTMAFVSGVILLGSLASVSQVWARDSWVGLSMLSVLGAASMWWGLYLASHRLLGPLLIVAGAAITALTLYWTFVVPALAMACGIAGVLRAERLGRLRETRS